MAKQLGPVVGKVGGQEVQEIPIDFVAPSSTGTYNVVTVPVPAGVTATVCLFITSHNATNTTSNRPTISFGEYTNVVYSTTSSPWGASVTSTGPVTVRATKNMNISAADPSFKGHILWWVNS